MSSNKFTFTDHIYGFLKDIELPEKQSKWEKMGDFTKQGWVWTNLDN